MNKAIVTVACSAFAGVAAAQPCFQILETSPLMGADYTLSQLLNWDPDGPGPLSELLVASGNFAAVGSISARGVAAFDGTNWLSLGDGAADPGSYNVAALGTYNGDLVAAPRVVAAGATVRSVMRYNRLTGQWSPVGASFDGNNNFPEVLVQYGSDLIVGGALGGIGGVANTNCLAAWDGSNWRSIVTISGFPSIGTARVFGGRLVVGGSFSIPGVTGATNIAAWDGTTWTALGSGLSGVVSSLMEFNGQLIAAGSFTGSPAYVAAWNGTSWQAMGSLPSAAKSLEAYNGELHCLTHSGITDTLWRWNGSAWVNVATLQETSGPSEVYQGKLYLGGRVWLGVADNTRLRFVTAWDGTSFKPTNHGTNAAVNAFTTWNGDLYAGGDFTEFNGQVINHVARRIGSVWQPVGTGVNGSVYAVVPYGNGIVAAGSFTTAGGAPAANIARWDGAAWAPLGAGVNGVVYTLCLDAAGNLVAGGSFTSAGGAPAARVARWNGSSWTPLGGGTDGPVRDLALYQGNIVATGNFSIAQPVWARGIAAFNGAAWTTLGPEPQGQAGLISSNNIDGVGVKLAVDGEDLWVAGSFVRAGNTQTANVALYRGGAWQAVGRAGSSAASVAMGPHGRMVIGQDGYIFERTPAGTWQSVVGFAGSYGLPVQETRVIKTMEGALYMGGVMDVLNGKPAAGWAKVAFGAPLVLSTTFPSTVPVGETMTLAVAAEGAPPLTYQWRKDGVLLSDQGRISGTATGTLTVTSSEAGDVGTYTVTVTSGCGDSTTATMPVSGPCAADIGVQGGGSGQDGILDNNDFVVFIDYFFNHNPSADVGRQGGVGPGDGVFDNNDFVVFIDLFFTGCP